MHAAAPVAPPVVPRPTPGDAHVPAPSRPRSAPQGDDAPARTGRRAAPAATPVPEQLPQHAPARRAEVRATEPMRPAAAAAAPPAPPVDRHAREGIDGRPPIQRPRTERPTQPEQRPIAERPVPVAQPERERPRPDRPAPPEQRPIAERPVTERERPRTERPTPAEQRPIAERPASMRPLHPPAPRVIPADLPRTADRVASRRDAPRDLRADSTDDLSAVLSAAANTGRAPDGLEFREFDVEPPRDPRGSAPERASAARDRVTAAAAPRPTPAPDRASAPNAQRSPAPGDLAAAAASRPVSRRSLRNALTSRVASTVAMGFVALLAVATSVPSLSLLSPADVQAMALSETTVVTIDGQHVDITGDAAAAAIGREAYQAQSIEEYARAAGIRPEATFTNNPLGTIQWPFAVGVHIGDRFGYRNCAGCSSNHRGQDFNPGDGAHIQSIADGVVSVSTDAGGSLGAVTMIDHVIDGQTVTSVYAHMQYGTRRFEVGDRVEVGDVVGNTGNTGMSTGPHLHFEIRIGGVGGTHVDPLEWLWANTN